MTNCKFVRVNSISLAAVLVLLSPMVTAAQAVFTQIRATEVFDPLNLFGSGPVGTFINSGAVTCPGGQPTGDPMQPCPAGSRINIRGMQIKDRTISQSPLLTGWQYPLEINVDFDSNATGREWGTFRIELDAGGVWEGTWTADRIKMDNVWVDHISGVARGKGGSVDGMQMQFTEVITAFGEFLPAWGGSIEARILAPPCSITPAQPSANR